VALIFLAEGGGLHFPGGRMSFLSHPCRKKARQGWGTHSHGWIEEPQILWTDKDYQLGPGSNDIELFGCELRLLAWISM
jgi:hypothetical protein